MLIGRSISHIHSDQLVPDGVFTMRRVTSVAFHNSVVLINIYPEVVFVFLFPIERLSCRHRPCFRVDCEQRRPFSLGRLVETQFVAEPSVVSDISVCRADLSTICTSHHITSPRYDVGCTMIDLAVHAGVHSHLTGYP